MPLIWLPSAPNLQPINFRQTRFCWTTKNLSRSTGRQSSNQRLLRTSVLISQRGVSLTTCACLVILRYLSITQLPWTRPVLGPKLRSRLINSGCLAARRFTSSSVTAETLTQQYMFQTKTFYFPHPNILCSFGEQHIYHRTCLAFQVINL